MLKPTNHFSILILITQMERGGAQKIAFTQARYFYQQGHDVTLCFFYDKFGHLPEIRTQEPYDVVCLNAKKPGDSKFRSGLRIIHALMQLYRLLKYKHIDVIETLTHYSNILGIIVAWVAGVPVRISSQRNSLSNFPKWFWYLDRFLVNSHLVDKMIAVSESTRRFCIEIEGMNSDKVITIPNGVNLDLFEQKLNETSTDALRNSIGIPEKHLILTTVARLHPQKGHLYLIEAARQLITLHPNIIFLLVGEGAERTKIENGINHYGLVKHFRMLGNREDVTKVLNISDLFVLPSLYEGMPNVVLEAMAAKLAVVATCVDGTSEIVIHSKTGLLVPPANANALVQTILSLLKDDSRRKCMGYKGFERIRQEFSEEIMCYRYEKLIQSILLTKRVSLKQ